MAILAVLPLSPRATTSLILNTVYTLDIEGYRAGGWSVETGLLAQNTCGNVQNFYTIVVFL